MKRMWIVGVAVVLITAGAIVFDSIGSPSARTHSLQATHPRSQVVRSPAPECNPASPPYGAEVHVATLPSDPGFDSPCYYAVSNTPLTVVLLNKTVGIEDGKAVPANISIWRQQSDALRQNEDGALFIDGTKALFEGKHLYADRSITYRVPALPPGTYFVQDDYDPLHTFATLILAGGAD
jgi:hypothetical protein